MLRAHLIVRWSDQHALHHALAADVIEGRVVESGNQGCGLSSHVLRKLGWKLGLEMFFFSIEEKELRRVYA